MASTEPAGGTGQDPAARDLYPAARLAAAAAATSAAGLDALLLTPGPDLRYVTGYAAHQLERLTCLAIPAAGPPFLVVPRLELPAAQASPAGGLGLEIIPWDETDDPYTLVAGRLGASGGSGGASARAGIASVGLADRMWALMVLRLREVLPDARLASEVPDHPAQKRPVIACYRADIGDCLEKLVRRRAVSGEIILAAKEVVVNPGDIRRARINAFRRRIRFGHCRPRS